MGKRNQAYRVNDKGVYWHEKLSHKLQFCKDQTGCSWNVNEEEKMWAQAVTSDIFVNQTTYNVVARQRLSRQKLTLRTYLKDDKIVAQTKTAKPRNGFLTHISLVSSGNFDEFE